LEVLGEEIVFNRFNLCAVNRHRYITEAQCIDKLGDPKRKTELCGDANRAPILAPDGRWVRVLGRRSPTRMCVFDRL